MRVIRLDGRDVGALTAALADALAGGPTVVPLDATNSAWDDLDGDEPDTALIVTTSGSTGAAKGVLLSAAALTASANATHDRLGGPGHWLLATPARYIGGVQVLVRSLLAGTTPGVVDLSLPFRGDSFADAAAPVLAATGPRYTAMVPTQLTRLLDEGGRGLAALRAFDRVIIGAAATPAELAERAATDGVRIIAAYGMSETASGCVYDGVSLAGATVRLADDRIEIAGPMLAHGYRRDPALTAECFHDGWFRTGDTGRFDGDRLVVLGRADDLINTGGVKVAPALVERVLAAQPGVRAACVVGLPDPRWGEAVVAVVVPIDPAAPPVPAALADAVRGQIGRTAVPKRFEFATELPLRGPGKVDRAAVRAFLAR